MTDMWMLREGMTLRPFGSESAEVFSKIPFGKMVHVAVKQPRNAKHAALYWVLCHRIADAVGVNAENISDVLKIETGHCDIIKSKTHGELRLPRSISFAKMDQPAFDTFFNRCVEVIQTNWGIARSDILECVKDLLERDAA